MNDLLKAHLLPADTDRLTLAVHNPATGDLIGNVAAYDAAQIPEIIAKAEEVRHGWAAQTAKQRAAILRKWFTLIMENQVQLAEIITAECGKPRAEAMGEVPFAASFVEWYAEEGKRTYGDVIPSHAPDKRILVMKQPVGTCAAITPWNFPLGMVTRKVAPALAAGCSMVLKPAELTPLSALAIEQLALEAGIPEGLFKVVPTNDPSGVGKALCDSPVVRKLSFTGSTAVGKLLMEQCAGTLKRLSLELGGNAPFIIFDDADVDAAIDGLMACKYRNAGQTCVSANRVLVQDGIYDAVAERLTERTSQLKVGNGADEGTNVGPLISDKAIAGVSSLVDRALEQGAEARTGGAPHELGGQFYTPTVLTDVTPEMDIAQCEIFGPVATLIRFKDEADAIRIANDTPYGLAAYFYARDLGRVWRVTEALEYGMVAANDALLSTEAAPFGGIKESGMGREGSKYGIEDYLEIKYSLMSGITS